MAIARHLGALALLATLASSATVTFYSGEDCSSGPIYGGQTNYTVPCYRLDNHLDVVPGNSTSVENILQGQSVLFFSDNECQNEVYQTSSDVCYEHQGVNVAAFQILQSAKDTTALSTTPYQDQFALTNYHGNVSNPASVDLISDTVYLGAAAAIGVIALGKFALEILGCVTTNGESLPLSTCIVGIGGSIVTFLLSGVLALGARERQFRFRKALGNAQNIKRDALNSINEEYMSSVMNITSLGGSHIGYASHDIGNGIHQRSPVWELPARDGPAHHVAAFYDDASGEFNYRFGFARRPAVTARQVTPKYNDEMWNDGGIDAKLCPYNPDADLSGFRKDPTVLYNTVYNDLNCLISPDQIQNSGAITVTAKNGAGVMVAQIFLQGFSGNDPSVVNQLGTCGKIVDTPEDQVCQF